MTLCSGSLGARPDNDLPGMMERLGDKVHFCTCATSSATAMRWSGRSTRPSILGGDTDMVALIAEVLQEEARRKKAGRSRCTRSRCAPITGRTSLTTSAGASQPGYPTIGRLKGLAELRGVMAALTHKELGIA